jgi:hypothetical protein
MRSWLVGKPRIARSCRARIGATMCVVLVACFPQHRILFLGGLAVWGAPALSLPCSCVTLGPMAHRWPDILRRLSPAACSALSAGSMQTQPS